MSPPIRWVVRPSTYHDVSGIDLNSLNGKFDSFTITAGGALAVDADIAGGSTITLSGNGIDLNNTLMQPAQSA